jgi:hypothetical protein
VDNDEKVKSQAEIQNPSERFANRLTIHATKNERECNENQFADLSNRSCP